MWWFIASVVVGALGAIYLQPKTQDRPPASFDEFDFPTADEGREVPVLFGTKKITGPNILWTGDFDTDSIKAKGGK